jgi:BirA family biotin operon repressor/biotin-[acetyl-CoA-carboxylase] ligase
VNISLLYRLRAASGDFVPYDRLAGDAGLDGLGRDLDELASFGFGVERHPILGASYRGHAERLCPDQIEFGLDVRRVGRRVAVWNRVTSTNDLAARAARSASNEGLVVLAEEQSAGRGRRGRTWTAPARSSILMSVLLFPTGPLAEPAWLTALGAVAVAEVVSAWVGRPASIKWPNDVRVDGRKIAGILVERGAGAVIGIGVNANLTPEALPAEVRPTATSLRILNGSPADRSELARDLIRRLDALYDRALREGPRILLHPWRDRIELLGRPVIVLTLSGPAQGRLDDLDPFDGLWLIEPSGRRSHVVAAQILAIAPAGPSTTEQLP